MTARKPSPTNFDGIEVPDDPAPDAPAHTCCYHVRAAKAVLADRERELLAIKGHCGWMACRLHYAHSGPCDTREGS